MNHSGHLSTSAAVADYPGDLKPPRVLAIDDDPNVLQAIQREFHRYDIDLLQAYHGAHGIWLATTQQPDLIITDLRMPQGRGEYVVDYLKENRMTCGIPIIVLTGLLDDRLERRMWKLGISEYLTKPISLKVLCKAVGRFVELRTSDREGRGRCPGGGTTSQPFQG